jgi:hypothetical protein
VCVWDNIHLYQQPMNAIYNNAFKIARIACFKYCTNFYLGLPYVYYILRRVLHCSLICNMPSLIKAHAAALFLTACLKVTCELVNRIPLSPNSWTLQPPQPFPFQTENVEQKWKARQGQTDFRRVYKNHGCHKPTNKVYPLHCVPERQSKAITPTLHNFLDKQLPTPTSWPIECGLQVLMRPAPCRHASI